MTTTIDNSNLTLTKLQAMLVLQDSLNKKVNPRWQTAGFNWPHAIMVETVELFDHLNWKWWKTYKSQPDYGQVKMEAVDIWHFIMSMVLEKNKAPEEIARSLNEGISSAKIFAVSGCNDKMIQAACTALLNSVTTFSPDVLQCTHDFGALLDTVGLDMDDLYRLYIGKAQLNEFRWANDYGGSYQKHWFGQEDNQYLTDLVQTLDSNSPTFAQDIAAGLKARYDEVIWGPGGN